MGLRWTQISCMKESITGTWFSIAAGTTATGAKYTDTGLLLMTVEALSLG